MENRTIGVGEIYKHFSGKLYQIVAIGRHAETMENYVIYQELFGGFEVYVVKREEFISCLDMDGKQVYKFEKVEKSSLVDEKMENVSATNSDKVETAACSTEENKVLNSEMEMAISQSKNKDGMRRFMEFLDADTYKEKLDIFMRMQDKLDERILVNIAASLDLVVDEKNIDESVLIIIKNLEQRSNFECFRLR